MSNFFPGKASLYLPEVLGLKAGWPPATSFWAQHRLKVGMMRWDLPSEKDVDSVLGVTKITWAQVVILTNIYSTVIMSYILFEKELKPLSMF